MGQLPRHLTVDELARLARDPRAAPPLEQMHVRTCGVCRGRLLDLRGLRDALSAPAPADLADAEPVSAPPPRALRARRGEARVAASAPPPGPPVLPEAAPPPAPPELPGTLREAFRDAYRPRTALRIRAGLRPLVSEVRDLGEGGVPDRLAESTLEMALGRGAPGTRGELRLGEYAVRYRAHVRGELLDLQLFVQDPHGQPAAGTRVVVVAASRAVVEDRVLDEGGALALTIAPGRYELRLPRAHRAAAVLDFSIDDR